MYASDTSRNQLQSWLVFHYFDPRSFTENLFLSKLLKKPHDHLSWSRTKVASSFKYCSWNTTMKSVTLYWSFFISLRLNQVAWISDSAFERSLSNSYSWVLKNIYAYKIFCNISQKESHLVISFKLRWFTGQSLRGNYFSNPNAPDWFLHRIISVFTV